jgi:hypothetical protein
MRSLLVAVFAAHCRFACASFCLVAGCGQPGSGDPPAAAPGPAPAVGPPRADAGPADEVRAGERARWTGECARVVREVRAVLAGLPSPCETDADCVCYPGGIEAVTGCGRESDRETSSRISELTREFDRLRCDWGVDCAPRRCESACVDGKCASRPRALRVPGS